MSEIIDLLIEMGFTKTRAEQALTESRAKDIQEAMDWLLANEEEEEPTPEVSDENAQSNVTVTDNVQKDESSDLVETPANEVPADVKSIKCDECGKSFRTDADVEFHALKSGHSQFSQSTEEKKPLTEEEKREQLVKIDAKLKLRRLEREEREKQEQLEKERNRIRSGKDLLEAKRKQEEVEIKKIIDQRKREKQEEKLARERVKQQIEQDRQARKGMFSGDKPPVVTLQQADTLTLGNDRTEQQSYQEVKLQIRLTNGSALVQTFGAKEPLSAVRLYVEINRTDEPGPFALRTPLPAKVFKTEDYDKPLDVLGLAPSSVLIVSRT